MRCRFGTVMRLFEMLVGKRAEHFLSPRNGGRRPKWSGRKLNTYVVGIHNGLTVRLTVSRRKLPFPRLKTQGFLT
jgi:hypothetical protein